jgi:tetratricopeptide (TPR) repeat protein
MQTFKLFVSSPGDVMVERRRVENVVSRLNGEFSGVARLEAIRWETDFYQAYSTFQAQIPRSTECDLVIGILKWRLGTELPPDFGEKLPDGQPFPSGTAYEILTAIAKRQKGVELPDIYVFRFAGASPSVAVEDPGRAKIEHDWQALKSFFHEWFLSERGHFKAAFNPYTSEDDFEAQLERLLHKWVADKVVVGGRAVRWPIEVKGSPFRGLAAFGAKHAPVFFGRSRDIARAVDLWREAGARGCAYLLAVGASGSGKSSLVRAGLVPRLTTPGVIKEVDVWRIAVMRPSDSQVGPFAALAAALMLDESGLPKEEEGRGPALPEIAHGDSRTPAELAGVLRHADAAAVKPILNALARVAAGVHDRERYSREVRCDLVLLIDQAEELFAASVSQEERSGFIDLVAALVGTGRIWVVATLRADFYARMLDQPALKQLKELGAAYDLAPPGPVELAEIVRAPAQAAGLVYETDAASGERLDARLLRDAERPDMLPLVQLALSRLFEGRERVADETWLRLRVYESLGGLKGIIEEAGETALAALGEAEKARLPRLLRQLAVPAHDQDGSGPGALTIRAVPLAQAEPDVATHKLIDALVTARLLTTSGIDADAQVRLAHQRVLADWGRAHAIVAESADFYRIRADLDESRRKWEAGNRRSELLLARGLPLAEAESIVAKYADELAPEVRAYVRTSRQRANRAQMIGWSAAAAFAMLAVVAAGAAWLADRNQMRASRNLALAIEQSDTLVGKIGDELQNLAGVSKDGIRRILQVIEGELAQISRIDPGNARLALSRAAMLSVVADNYVDLGDLTAATDRARQCVDIARPLADTAPGDIDSLRGLARCLQSLGYAAITGGDVDSARPAYQASIALRRRVLASRPDDATVLDELSRGLNLYASLLLRTATFTDARDTAQESLDIAIRLVAIDPDNPNHQRENVDSRNILYIALYRLGQAEAAMAGFNALLAIARDLAASRQDNATWQRYLSNIVGNAGYVLFDLGRQSEGMAALDESLSLKRLLVRMDPTNLTWLSDLVNGLYTAGEMLTRMAQTADAPAPADRHRIQDALAAYREALDGARVFVGRDPKNAKSQFELIACLWKVSLMQSRIGDAGGAYDSSQEALTAIAKLDQSSLDSGQQALIKTIQSSLSK